MNKNTVPLLHKIRYAQVTLTEVVDALNQAAQRIGDAEDPDFTNNSAIIAAAQAAADDLRDKLDELERLNK